MASEYTLNHSIRKSMILADQNRHKKTSRIYENFRMQLIMTSYFNTKNETEDTKTFSACTKINFSLFLSYIERFGDLQCIREDLKVPFNRFNL